MRRRILFALVPFALVVVLATLGYMAFWHWPALDAFYMTVISVGTVGFGEVHPLTAGGRLFTIGVIFAGAISGGYALARIIELLVAGQLEGVWEGRRMNKRIAELDRHTVLAGIGRVGSAVARTLDEQGVPFVVVDKNEETIAEAREAGWLIVQGDATEEETLRRAGIIRAGSLITALDSDAENLFVTVTARSLNAGLFIVARSSHESTEPKMLKAGADRVLTPNLIGGRRMAGMVMHPSVSDYLDLVSHVSQFEYRLQEIEVSTTSPFAGRSISELRVRETTGCYILAVRHADGTFDANPSGDARMVAGDHLIVLGTEAEVDHLAQGA